jgi:hypothetical protein
MPYDSEAARRAISRVGGETEVELRSHPIVEWMRSTTCREPPARSRSNVGYRALGSAA